jgi:recombination protein RecA
MLSPEAQKGGQYAFIDAEHALDPTRAEAIGVNLDELLMSQQTRVNRPWKLQKP